MNVQFSEGLPLLEFNEARGALILSPADTREKALTNFYEHFLSGDIEPFKINRDHAAGLYELLAALTEQPVQAQDRYIKGQTVGPVTFTASIKDAEGNLLFHDRELREALANGLAVKALWQVRMLERSGRKPVIFLDEPYLSGFGSAFSPIERHEVIELLQGMIHYLRQHTDVLIGIHCCGNTDWSMILDAGPDIVNFDAFDHMDYFLLYPRDIKRFLNDGGIVAWGVVPTCGFTGKESVEALSALVTAGFKRIESWGIDPRLLARQSLLTPACGMGSLAEGLATDILSLLPRLTEALRFRFPLGH
jgi:methionine synthase II (cobalamin-independent)